MVSHKIKIFIFILFIIRGADSVQPGQAAVTVSTEFKVAACKANLQRDYESVVAGSLDNDLMDLLRIAFKQKLSCTYKYDESKAYLDLILHCVNPASTYSPNVFCNQQEPKYIDECMRQLHIAFEFKDDNSALEVIKWTYKEISEILLPHKFKGSKWNKKKFAFGYFNHMFDNIAVYGFLTPPTVFCNLYARRKTSDQYSINDDIEYYLKVGRATTTDLLPKENKPSIQPNYYSQTNINNDYGAGSGTGYLPSSPIIPPASTVISDDYSLFNIVYGSHGGQSSGENFPRNTTMPTATPMPKPYDYSQTDMAYYKGYLPSNTTQITATPMPKPYDYSQTDMAYYEGYLPSNTGRSSVPTFKPYDYSETYIKDNNYEAQSGGYFSSNRNTSPTHSYSFSGYSQPNAMFPGGSSSEGYILPSPTTIPPSSTIVPFEYSKTNKSYNYGAQSSGGNLLPHKSTSTTSIASYDFYGNLQEDTTYYDSRGRGGKFPVKSATTYERNDPYNAKR